MRQYIDGFRLVGVDGTGYSFEVDGVQQYGRGGDEVHARCLVALLIEGAVTTFVEPVEEHRFRSAWRASPLLSPAVERRRRSGFWSQSRMNSVRSIRPNTWAAIAAFNL